MQLLYLSPLYPPSIGGAQTYMHQLALALRKSGHSPRAICLSDKNREDWLRLATSFCEPDGSYVQDEIPVHRLGYDRRTRLLMLPWALLYYPSLTLTAGRLADLVLPHLERVAGQPEVIHASRVGREFLLQAGQKLARRLGVPYVLTPHHHPRWKGLLYRNYDQLYRQSDALLVHTAAEKATLVEQKGVDPERIHFAGVGPVLSPHWDAAQFRREHHLEGEFVLFLGQQYEYKGIRALLEAASLVWQRRPDVQFVFAGPPTDFSSRLFREVRDPRILNLGALDLSTKTSALAACDVFCLPSLQESFGAVFVEAWCHQKPVIGGKIPALSEVIDEGANGFLSEQEPQALAERILYLLERPGLREAFGKAGQEKVKRLYTWEKIADRVAAVYQQLR